MSELKTAKNNPKPSAANLERLDIIIDDARSIIENINASICRLIGPSEEKTNEQPNPLRENTDVFFNALSIRLSILDLQNNDLRIIRDRLNDLV